MKRVHTTVIISFIFFTACQKNNSTADTSTTIDGTYSSTDTLSIGAVAMYTSSLYSVGNPITDTKIIGDYLTRKNISGFSLSTATQPYSGKITVTLNNSSKTAAITNISGPALSLTIEGDGLYRSPNSDSLINLVSKDTLVNPKAVILSDSCYNYNATATTTAYQASSTASGVLTYRKKYPIQYKGGRVIINFINSSLQRTSGGGCVSIISGDWGYNLFSSVYGTMNRLGIGDTLVIQTKSLLLVKQ
jgi:hypothetical protein